MKSRKIYVLILVLICPIIFLAAQASTVQGLVPNIVRIDSFDLGSETWLNITITHSPPPTIGLGHYVATVEVEVNGTSQSLPQASPQNTTQFIVQFDLGPVTNIYNVRARAFCNYHGYGEWSNSITVPEYPFVALVIFVVLATSVTILTTKKLWR
jgi:hypothetical protein